HRGAATAFRILAASQPRSALAAAQIQWAAAGRAGNRRRDWLGLGRKRVALFVKVDDRRAARLALLVLDRVAGAAQELTEATLSLDHLAAAHRALVLADL